MDIRLTSPLPDTDHPTPITPIAPIAPVFSVIAALLLGPTAPGLAHPPILVRRGPRTLPISPRNCVPASCRNLKIS